MHTFMDTIPKRIGVLLLTVGAISLVIGFFQILDDSWKSSVFFQKWLDLFQFNRYRIKQYPLAFYGTCLVVAGLLLSVLYDRVTGKLVRWVVSGKP